MRPVLTVMIAAVGLCLGGGLYSLASAVDPAQSSGQSRQQDRQMQEQAKESRQQPSHTEFGGQPKDQAARERHHQQNAQSSDHLGPHDSDQSGAQGGSSGTGGRGEQQSRQGAVSGGTR